MPHCHSSVQTTSPEHSRVAGQRLARLVLLLRRSLSIKHREKSCVASSAFSQDVFPGDFMEHNSPRAWHRGDGPVLVGLQQPRALLCVGLAGKQPWFVFKDPWGVKGGGKEEKLYTSEWIFPPMDPVVNETFCIYEFFFSCCLVAFH